MSGRDERKISIYPPECPVCHKCHEWILGGRMWILTEESMNKRGLQYPVIATGIARLYQVSNDYVVCVTRIGFKTHTKFWSHTKTYHAIMKAFRANSGKPYNRTVSGSEISDVWER